MTKPSKRKRRTKRRSRSIFEKFRLKPSQLEAVAKRRFGDAQCLANAAQNDRANGAMYLAGYVIECLLKARLVKKHGWLATVRSPERLGVEKKGLWELCYRLHDLEGLRLNLPEVSRRLEAREQGGNTRLANALGSICAEWTVFARYAPRNASMDEARTFVAKVKEIKTCLE